MINQKNFFDEVDKIGIEKLPYPLRKSILYIWDETKYNRGWSRYSKDKEFKQMVDLAFEKLEEFIMTQKDQSTDGLEGNPEKIITGLDAAKELIRPYVVRGDSISELSKSMLGAAGGRYDAHIQKGKIFVTKLNGRKSKDSFPLSKIYSEVQKEKQIKSSSKGSANKLKEIEAIVSEKLPEEITFIRRYLAMNGKSKTKQEILNFTKSLQKAILERRIRKTSKYAFAIIDIQQDVVKLCNNMRSTAKIDIEPKRAEQYKKIVQSENIMPSVKFLKRYFNLQGKKNDPQQKRKVTLLAEQINKAWLSDKLKANDKYFNLLTDIMPGCLDIRNKPGYKTPLPVFQPELNGLPEEGKVMSSIDFAGMKFDTIGFTGKWLDFIGDPSYGFTAMVFGKPKFGKSYLCVDFAGYLARNHGKVLYAAKEEKLDATLQKKLNDKDVAHENLYVSDHLPSDLSPYDYIFLDSVTKFGFSPQEVQRLRQANPGKTFILIFQTTKDGHFRGDNAYQHDVDVVIEVPERGKAIQFGRFNQGGEMGIFENAPKETDSEQMAA